jgi:predicted aldo/keto reductase-like oxidoreductase
MAERDGSAGISGALVLGCWVVTILLGYVAVGQAIGLMIEGVDAPYIPKAPSALGILSLLGSLILTGLWARGRGNDAAPGEAPSTRRKFLIGAGAGVAGVVGASAATLGRNAGWMTVTGPNIASEVPTSSETPKKEWEGSRVQSYRRLGRTDMMVSDIVLGTGRINLDNDGEGIARAVIERGVNYFDTAPDYSGHGSELAVGRAIKALANRDEFYLATKFCTGSGHLGTNASVQDYMDAIDGSLGRLNTDYVDLAHIHSCDNVDRLMSENAHEAFDRLKEQGKVRFLGVSTHTPDLETVANAAIESDRFDVMMLAYHHGAWPGLGEIIDRAAAKDIGVVAMKTLKGAKHEGLLELRDQADSYPQAAFKWVLANPSVSCLVISFFEPQHVDEYLFASGTAPTPHDMALLERYDELIAGKHCFTHCGACLSSCPEGVPIHDVLRHRMYFEDYGDQKEAMRLYGRLETDAAACAGCSAPCLGACPAGVPIQERTEGAHRMLRFG